EEYHHPSSPLTSSSHEQLSGKKNGRAVPQEQEPCLEGTNSRCRKRRKVSQQTLKVSGTGIYDPVGYWASTSFWPKDFWQRGFQMSQEPSNKRKSESTHRSQILERLAAYGVFMETSRLIQKDSQNLCAEYLKGDRKTVKTSVYTTEQFSKVLMRVYNLNEARIQKDVMPWVVPSAETLMYCGDLNLDYIGEEYNAIWIKCATMGSKAPKPDYTAGLLSTAFTEEEVGKLENYAQPTRPFRFTPEICFPFLMCEAKTGERGMNEAERQNIHSGSIAVRAIFELYQEAYARKAPNRLQELNGKVLVFTISHDNHRVSVYGHYAVAEPEHPGGLRFYRYGIALFSLSIGNGADRCKAYNFVMNVYENFAPDHLKRIKDAVAHLPSIPERTGLSFAASDMTLDVDADADDDDTSSDEASQEAPSRDEGVFKKPALPPSVLQQREMAKLRKQVGKLSKQLEQQRKDSMQQLQQHREDSMKQLEQQRQDSMQQLQQQKEIISLLRSKMA
ncbi:MAG: hypothetical protein LQ340_006814, partial [Diploschistes diacapsis]